MRSTSRLSTPLCLELPHSVNRRSGRLAGQKRRRLPAGRRARAQARDRAAAAGQAGDRSDRARHPSRLHGRASEAARVPGARAHRRPDHRRLHGARRRPERPLEHPPGARPEDDRRATRATFQEQALTVLDPDPELLEVRFNSEWLDMSMEELFRLARTTTVAQLLEREDFAERLAARASRSRCSSCCTRCSRATTRWRSGPTSSSAGPTRSSTSCWAATSSAPTGSQSRSS